MPGISGRIEIANPVGAANAGICALQNQVNAMLYAKITLQLVAVKIIFRFSGQPFEFF
jgi:hypothetical protein